MGGYIVRSLISPMSRVIRHLLGYIVCVDTKGDQIACDSVARNEGEGP